MQICMTRAFPSTMMSAVLGSADPMLVQANALERALGDEEFFLGADAGPMWWEPSCYAAERGFLGGHGLIGATTERLIYCDFSPRITSWEWPDIAGLEVTRHWWHEGTERALTLSGRHDDG